MSKQDKHEPIYSVKRRYHWYLGVLFALFSTALAQGAVLSEEFGAAGGNANGFANGGSVADSGVESVKLNPAMLALAKKYSLGGSYHFPSGGRDFYKAGIVDSTTSRIAAGFTYTGFAEPTSQTLAGEVAVDGRYVDRRMSLGLAIPTRFMAFGVTGQWTEAAPLKAGSDSELDPKQVIRGLTWNVGVVGLLSSGVRAGLSVEGLGSSEIKEYAPNVLRAGIAVTALAGLGGVHLDFVQTSSTEVGGVDEQTAISSFSMKVYDFFRLNGAYGKDVHAGADRETAALGISFVAPRVSLSFNKSAKDLRTGWNQDSVNMNLELAM